MVIVCNSQVAYLEGRINSLENALEEAGVQLCSVAQAAQQTVTVVGRICCDTGTRYVCSLKNFVLQEV